jgi:SAM-dependent methyltransferase
LGLARGAVALLIEESARRKYFGNIATLGVQRVYLSAADLARQFQRFEVKPALMLDGGRKPIDDRLLFKALGFEKLERFDYSDFEGAEHVVDLNRDGLPQQVREKFDVVLDSGTLEHVFHVPNALKNIISLVKVGGRVIFLSPSSNHLDHGFYMFSPTIFVDYFLVNKFEIDTCYVVRYSPLLDDLWDVYEYDAKRWREFHIGGLDDRPYAIFFVATRTAESTSGVVPQQNYYADTAEFYAGARLADGTQGNGAPGVSAGWSSHRAEQTASESPRKALRRSVGQMLRKFPFAYRLALRLLIAVEKKNFSKKLVGRY